MHPARSANASRLRSSCFAISVFAWQHSRPYSAIDPPHNNKREYAIEKRLGHLRVRLLRVAARDQLRGHEPRLCPGRNRSFGLLSALRAHTKAPYKTDLLWTALRALHRPARARTVGAA